LDVRGTIQQEVPASAIRRQEHHVDQRASPSGASFETGGEAGGAAKGSTVVRAVVDLRQCPRAWVVLLKVPDGTA
jgi:hypothetical protein